MTKKKQIADYLFVKRHICSKQINFNILFELQIYFGQLCLMEIKRLKLVKYNLFYTANYFSFIKLLFYGFNFS